MYLLFIGPNIQYECIRCNLWEILHGYPWCKFLLSDVNRQWLIPPILLWLNKNLLLILLHLPPHAVTCLGCWTWTNRLHCYDTGWCHFAHIHGALDASFNVDLWKVFGKERDAAVEFIFEKVVTDLSQDGDTDKQRKRCRAHNKLVPQMINLIQWKHIYNNLE